MLQSLQKGSNFALLQHLKQSEGQLEHHHAQFWSQHMPSHVQNVSVL